MKNLVAASLLSLAALAAPAQAIDFTGPAAPANWTTTVLGTLASPGSATFAPTQLALLGGDSAAGCAGGTYGFVGPCEIRTTLAMPGLYSFHWSYVTSDADGPGGDIFGVLVDSTRISLSDPGGAPTQSGDRSFAATSSFGWFLNCSDCTGGSATALMSSFALVQAVPEPSTYALMALGLAGIGLLRRRKRP